MRHCTEKVHSIRHAVRNIRQVGRSRNITCQVTKAKLKDGKAVPGRWHWTLINAVCLRTYKRVHFIYLCRIHTYQTVILQHI